MFSTVKNFYVESHTDCPPTNTLRVIFNLECTSSNSIDIIGTETLGEQKR